MLKRLKPYLLLSVTAMIWGFAFIAQLLGSDLPAFLFNGTRFLLGSLSLIPVILIFERGKTDKNKMKTTLIVGIVAGVVLCVASNLQQFGVNITGSAAKSGFITGMYMIFVPIAGIFMKKKTTVNVWIGAVVALIGLYILSFPEGVTSVGIGDLILLCGAVFWTAHIIIIDNFGNKIYSLRFSMIQFITCALINIVLVIFTDSFDLKLLLDTKYPILYAGLMSVGVAYTLQVIGQKNAEPTVASIVLSTESVFSAVGEAIFFTFIMVGYDKYKPLNPIGYIGCIIMFCGITITQFTFKRKKLTKGALT